MKGVILLFFFMSQFMFSNAQNKAERFFNTALNYYNSDDYSIAEQYCHKALKKNKNYRDAYILLGQIYYKRKKYVTAIYYMKKAIETDTSFSKSYIQLAEYLLKIKKFDSVIYYVDISRKYETDSFWRKKASTLKQKAIYRKFAYKNPYDINIIRLPESINTRLNEYFPTILADNKTLIFTRLLIANDYDFQEDIFYSINDGQWSEALPLPGVINSKENEGAHTFTTDGKVMIFTRCITGSGCDLYITEYIGNIWSRPVKLPYPVNTKYWESQPSLASDGKTLYFSSNRPGGKGKMDIWKTIYLGNGKWSKPVNLEQINTEGNEMSPFIHFDNKTLYFASDGLIGMGGFDLFVTRKKDGHWTESQNLGFPINTENDEMRLSVGYLGQIAYYSKFTDSIYQNDIYMFELPEKFRPKKTIYLKVHIFSSLDYKPVKTAYQILNLKNNDTIFSGYSDYFLVSLPEKGNFALNLIPKNYLFYSENIDLSQKDSLNFIEKNIYLKPLTNGSKFILSNLFFDFDSSVIKKESYGELDKLYEFMKKNPAIKIEIEGHTDSIGTIAYNMQLSEQRAKSVAKYLINKGINPERITYKGYGASSPIADNSTEAGRKKNRRTEIIIFK